MEASVLLYLEILCSSPDLNATYGLWVIAGIRGLLFRGFEGPCFRQVPHYYYYYYLKGVSQLIPVQCFVVHMRQLFK